MSDEKVAKTFESLVLKGKIRSAVRFATMRDKGGFLAPDATDEKTGLTVLEVLKGKHPEAIIPDAEVLEEYSEVPDMVPLDTTSDTVTEVAAKLSGVGGPGGVDAVRLQQWLLRFGTGSHMFRGAVAGFTCWMVNETPPWAAYWALMANRLLTLDKCPGVRPVRIGEIWRRLLAKYVLHEAGAQVTEICGNDNLCAGLKADIDCAVHAVRVQWATKEEEEEEEWGFLLADAANAFNAGNRIAFL